MAIDPRLLMMLLSQTPALLNSLQRTFGKGNEVKGLTNTAPNVVNALGNGYDTGNLNDLYQRLYDKRALDGIDRNTDLDALGALNNQYGPREIIPELPAQDSVDVFNNSPIQISDFEANAPSTGMSEEDWMFNDLDSTDNPYAREALLRKIRNKR